MRMKVLMMLLGLVKFMLYLELLNYIMLLQLQVKNQRRLLHTQVHRLQARRENPKKKKRLLTDEESDWLKCDPSYTRLPPKGSTRASELQA
jgi:hypothetical protein